MSNLSDLAEKRGRIFPGGNSNRFVELVGGRDIIYSFCEINPQTARNDYYYNTRTNTLYKLVKVTNKGTGKTDAYWKQVSEC